VLGRIEALCLLQLLTWRALLLLLLLLPPPDWWPY
jgi:hypothetical protein